jgi:lipoyl(octanoyl) transferase
MNAALEPRAGSRAAGEPLIRHLGLVDYASTWRAMQRLTDERTACNADEIWFLEHPPIFTLGMSAKPVHLLAPGDIPVLQIDRGGQVTYHGPGQLVVYPLIDLKRTGLTVRSLVSALEDAVVSFAAEFGVQAQGRPKAPGVYVGAEKLASIGIRIRRNCSYHGLALNVNMDLEPFGRINPCGYPGLKMAQLVDLGGPGTVAAAAAALEPHLRRTLFTRG